MSSAEAPDHRSSLARLRGELAHLEDLLVRPGDQTETGGPAWLRQTPGEHRLPATVAILAIVGLQLALPVRLVFRPFWLLPSLELLLFLLLLIGNPIRIERESARLRLASLALLATISLANAWSAVSLVLALVRGTAGEQAGPLLTSGGAIWLTNVIMFGLWYWELDRGGPAARATGRRQTPDFLFPQMQAPTLAAPNWEPAFLDYLYISFTNATAFSPTDVMPLSRWSKMIMLLQATISLVTVALVVARAVNVLR
jgi:uncharacterized membrane protein